jgi:thiol-disulfide isomerase/thioredoxin
MKTTMAQAGLACCLLATTLMPAAGKAQREPAKVYSQAAKDSLKALAEANPDSLSYHEQYIKAVGFKEAGTVAQYEQWMKKHPRSVTLPLAIGTAFYESEYPEAKPYLLKVVALDPKLAKAWFMLSIDADRWGNENASRDYMGKASVAAPEDPSYAFYYAMDFEHTDPAKWRTMLYALAKRYPAHERGAQGLYWLATRSTDPAEKLKVYEQLRAAYPPEKFNWSSSGMSSLYDQYLLNTPEKAVALAKDLGPKNGWGARDTLAQNVIRVRALLAEKKYQEAFAITNAIKIPRYSQSADMLALLKAEVTKAAGNTTQAYTDLLSIYAKTPGDAVATALHTYGTQLGKNNAQVEADVWRLRDSSSKPAPPFSLGLYTSAGKASLEDYKGKVVLLTFWFPGCGPCRGEFPHFQAVVDGFKGKDLAYLGINVFPEQDEYVVPFMKGTKYSFVPLRGESKWAADTYKVRGEPTNFLIDQQGRIVFSDFRTDSNNRRTLELMISSLLEHGKKAGNTTASN